MFGYIFLKLVIIVTYFGAVKKCGPCFEIKSTSPNLLTKFMTNYPSTSEFLNAFLSASYKNNKLIKHDYHYNHEFDKY